MTTSNNHTSGSSHPLERSSPAELDQLLHEVGTANPQELLGAGARTSLAAAMFQATALTALLMALFTFGPHLWSSPSSAPAPKSAPAAPEAVAKPAPAPTTNPETIEKPGVEAVKPGPRVDTAKTAPPVSNEALNKLGVTDTKKGDPKVNPLEKGTDDLLKDLDKK